MFKLAKEEIEEFKALLRTKAKEKGLVPHIESSLALRLMLEYYRREKKWKFLAVSQLFNLCPDKHYGFSSFKTICKNLNSDTSEL